MALMILIGIFLICIVIYLLVADYLQWLDEKDDE